VDEEGGVVAWEDVGPTRVLRKKRRRKKKGKASVEVAPAPAQVTPEPEFTAPSAAVDVTMTMIYSSDEESLPDIGVMGSSFVSLASSEEGKVYSTKFGTVVVSPMKWRVVSLNGSACSYLPLERAVVCEETGKKVGVSVAGRDVVAMVSATNRMIAEL